MAKPIKATPVLQGSASKRFNTLLQSQQNVIISKEEKSRIFSLVERILSQKR